MRLPLTLGLLALAIATMVLITLPDRKTANIDEPLADPASLSLLAQGEPLPAPIDEETAEFLGTRISPPKLSALLDARQILGFTSDANKHIEVDLTHQKVYAFEGDTKVYEFIVSTGKWGRTPTGEFTIWTKVKSQLMKGGKKELGTYYYLPNVPWVMFFYNNEIAKMRGFSFHGTYWHSNFGTPMSHGCINMKTEDAKILYDWATPVVTNPKAWSTPVSIENPGTRVVIYGVAPKS